jgi:4-hydroxybutyrate dehydrogenase
MTARSSGAPEALFGEPAVIHGFGRVRFGFGVVASLGAELAELGITRPILATEWHLAELGILQRVREHAPRGAAMFDALPAQPTVAGAEGLAAAYVENGCDGIVAVGGGVVIDMCKAAALLTGNPGPLIRYSGHPERIVGPVAPIVAVPTTAGTGSEVSRGAGIHPAPGAREFGVRGEPLLPRVALCDPDLTMTLPPKATAGTGLDALGHCIEGFLSPAINPVVDAIALDGIRRVARYVERAVADGGDREARWHMMMAAVEGGMAISKGLGCAHALSMTFSDSDLHHGAIVTVALPVVMRFVAPAAPAKLAQIAEAMGTPPGTAAADALAALNARVGLPGTIRALGYRGNDHDGLAAFAHDNYFNRTSPRIPGLDDYRRIIAELLH